MWMGLEQRGLEEAMPDDLENDTPALIGLSPYLYYADPAAALDWLTDTFGFGPDRRWTDPDGEVTEADIYAGDTRIMLGGRAPGDDEGAGVMLVIHVHDVDDQHRRVTAAGVGLDPPEDQPYRPRTITVTDPWGYRWCFWQGEAHPPPD